MKGREAVVLETLFRIQRFLDDSTPMLVAVNQSEARKRLDDTAAQMGSLAVAQVEGSRTTQGETARQRQLRLTLRTVHMRPITVIASQKLREQPEFTKLLLPAFKVQGTRLTATARDMANAAVPHTDLFGKEGLAPEFVAELRAATNALEESTKTQGRARGQRAGATRGLKAATTRARALIRQLDALVRPRLGRNEERLRAWEVGRHIKRPRTSRSETPSVSSSPTGTSSSTAPAAAPSTTPTVAAVPDARR